MVVSMSKGMRRWSEGGLSATTADEQKEGVGGKLLMGREAEPTAEV